MNAKDVQMTLRAKADSDRAKNSAWYFKTGKGEYGEGDKFIGVSVPLQRKIAHQFRDLALFEIEKLLKSHYHEDRFTALEILVMQYERAKNDATWKKIVSFYLKHTKYINNWDLVDTSAPYIIGPYFYDKPKKTLFKLAKSKNLWERRIAIVSTFYLIRQDRFAEAVKIAKMFLCDKHDLIQKATGWMLREMGKRNVKKLKAFLGANAHKMPRTMLRYAVERLSTAQRKLYVV